MHFYFAHGFVNAIAKMGKVRLIACLFDCRFTSLHRGGAVAADESIVIRYIRIGKGCNSRSDLNDHELKVIDAKRYLMFRSDAVSIYISSFPMYYHCFAYVIACDLHKTGYFIDFSRKNLKCNNEAL